MMSNEKMTFTKFETVLTAYGARAEAWPDELRDAMLGYIETDTQAKALLAREAQLDNFLSDRLPEPRRALQEAVLRDMHTALDPRNQTTDALMGYPVGLSPMPARRAYGLAITALAACFAFGFIAAPIMFDNLTADADLLASLEIISDTFLPTNPL